MNTAVSTHAAREDALNDPFIEAAASRLRSQGVGHAAAARIAADSFAAALPEDAE